MLFCTWNFAQFFVVVFGLYWFVPWRRLRWNVALPRGRSFTLTGDEIARLAASGGQSLVLPSWSHQLVLLIVVSTLIDYCIGLGLEAIAADERTARPLQLQHCRQPGHAVFFQILQFLPGVAG